MRKHLLLSLLGLLLGTWVHAQNTTPIPANLPKLLEGKRIALDPGHGGHDADDREIILGNGFTYWESDCNWEVAHLFKDLLEATGASVKITRPNNDPAAPDRDPFLSERVAVANAFNADYMHSIHTNGADGSTNYTLLLYRGTAQTVDWPEAKRMGDIMSPRIKDYLYTTVAYNRADKDFLPYHLGVLAGTNMPATLSEASFHDFLPEGKRLMSPMYRKAIVWAMFKSFLDFYGKESLPYGEVGGLVRDQDLTPQNGAVCTLKGEGLERTVTIDNTGGGYYLFDWVPAGAYTLTVIKEGCAPASTNITVQAGKYARTDIPMTNLTAPPARPVLRMVGVGAGATSLTASWDKMQNVDGYRLYYATDDGMQTWKLAADEKTLKGDVGRLLLDTQTAFKEVPTAPANHFRLVAVRLAGATVLEGEASDIYSCSSGGTGDKILIVDGFDRRGGKTSYTKPTHAFAAYYGSAIRKGKNAHFSTADHQLVVDGTLKLKDYQAVVWFLSDESTVDETFSLQEQALVKEYLQAGGKLLVSGPEIGWDLSAKGTADDQAFYTDYLKSVFQDDGAEDFLPVRGVTGTPFDGLKMDVGAYYPEDYPDAITPVAGALRILDYAKASYGAGVAYLGTFGSGTVPGGVVHVSFGLENLPQGQLDAFMKVALNYLKVNVEVVSGLDEDTRTQGFSLAPNPSTDQAWLQLPADLAGKSLEARLFTVAGAHVATWVLLPDAGQTRMPLPVARLSAGLYLLQLPGQDGRPVVLRLLKR